MKDPDVIQLGSPSYPTIISFENYKGKRFVDIRKYYRDKITNELKPTRKGIFISYEVFKSLNKIFEDKDGIILKWLEEGIDKVKTQAYNNMLEQAKALLNAAIAPRNYHSSSENFVSNKFFEIKTEGSKDFLRFNNQHEFYKLIEKNNLSKSQQSVFDLFFITFYRTTLRFEGNIEEINSNVFFDLFQNEWSIMLKNYSQKITNTFKDE